MVFLVLLKQIQDLLLLACFVRQSLSVKGCCFHAYLVRNPFGKDVNPRQLIFVGTAFEHDLVGLRNRSMWFHASSS